LAIDSGSSALSQGSYKKVKHDGAPMKCSDCGERDNKPFLQLKTPNGKTFVSHHECVDPDWLKSAKYEGEI